MDARNTSTKHIPKDGVLAQVTVGGVNYRLTMVNDIPRLEIYEKKTQSWKLVLLDKDAEALALLALQQYVKRRKVEMAIMHLKGERVERKKNFEVPVKLKPFKPN